MWRKRKPDLAKGALAGLAGGLTASFVMNQFQVALAKVKVRREEARCSDVRSGQFRSQWEARSS